MTTPRTALLRLNAALDRLCAWGGWLALPVSWLLLAQWPLRSVAGGRPQLANDVAQALFALYVAIALRHATRCRAHLAADVVARHFQPATRRRIRRLGALAVLLPWSAALLWLAAPQVWQSLRQLEGFAETNNPGYFIVKLALGMLLLLQALQALIDASKREPA